MTEAAVQPLLNSLGFVPVRAHRGLPFRCGLFSSSGDDFEVITAAMGVAPLAV